MLNKIRFQNPYFRRKLKEARGYKRPAKKIPENKLGIFLARMGLGGIFSRFLAGVLLFLLVYTLFIPNFFTVKTITIIGLETAAKENALSTTKNYLNSIPLWPQRNLLLLSTKKLSQYLGTKSFGVSKVIQIEKDFPSNLRIKLLERFNKFLLESSSGIYTVSNDGLIIKQLKLEDLAQNSPGSAIQTLITLNLGQDKIFYEKQSVADAKYFENLNELLALAENGLNNPIVKINLESFDRLDLAVETVAGYGIKFDINSDLPKVFSQLRLLLKEVGEARITGIKYIDMRIKDKGYVCYKDAPCAQENFSITATATSTSQELNIKD